AALPADAPDPVVAVPADGADPASPRVPAHRRLPRHLRALGGRRAGGGRMGRPVRAADRTVGDRRLQPAASRRGRAGPGGGGRARRPPPRRTPAAGLASRTRSRPLRGARLNLAPWAAAATARRERTQAVRAARPPRGARRAPDRTDAPARAWRGVGPGSRHHGTTVARRGSEAGPVGYLASATSLTSPASQPSKGRRGEP